MRAMIMAAGLGTRLRPLTDTLPKPLVPVAGRPMIEFVLELLIQHGYKEALVNLHYLPEKMQAFVAEWNRRGTGLVLSTQDETAEILGSGGALVKAKRWLFSDADTALVCNADVIARADLTALRAEHASLATAQGVECTLAVMAHPEAGAKYTGLEVENGLVRAFIEKGHGHGKLYHFPGFYCISRQALARLPASEEAFSVLERLWHPLAAERKLGAWRYEGEYRDLGTVEDLKEAEKFLAIG